MKTLLIKLLAVSLFSFPTLCNAQENDLSSDVRRMLNSYEIALRSKSASLVADNFHDDAMILPEGKPLVIGRDAIIENFKGLESIEFNEEFIIGEILSAGEYTIVQTRNIGSWSNPKTSENGTFEVKGQMVLKYDAEGALKIFRYAYNGNGSD